MLLPALAAQYTYSAEGIAFLLHALPVCRILGSHPSVHTCLASAPLACLLAYLFMLCPLTPCSFRALEHSYSHACYPPLCSAPLPPHADPFDWDLGASAVEVLAADEEGRHALEAAAVAGKA